MAIEGKIRELIEELEGLRATRDDHWQVPRIEGDLLYQIALSSGAKSIVEIGTSYGFSGLFWGAALGRVGGDVLPGDGVVHDAGHTCLQMLPSST